MFATQSRASSAARTPLRPLLPPPSLRSSPLCLLSRGHFFLLNPVTFSTQGPPSPSYESVPSLSACPARWSPRVSGTTWRVSVSGFTLQVPPGLTYPLPPPSAPTCAQVNGQSEPYELTNFGGNHGPPSATARLSPARTVGSERWDSPKGRGQSGDTTQVPLRLTDTPEPTGGFLGSFPCRPGRDLNGPELMRQHLGLRRPCVRSSPHFPTPAGATRPPFTVTPTP